MAETIEFSQAVYDSPVPFGAPLISDEFLRSFADLDGPISGDDWQATAAAVQLEENSDYGKRLEEGLKGLLGELSEKDAPMLPARELARRAISVMRAIQPVSSLTVGPSLAGREAAEVTGAQTPNLSPDTGG